MPINAGAIRLGHCYATAMGQVRKVIEVGPSFIVYVNRGKLAFPTWDRKRWHSVSTRGHLRARSCTRFRATGSDNGALVRSPDLGHVSAGRLLGCHADARSVVLSAALVVSGVGHVQVDDHLQYDRRCSGAHRCRGSGNRRWTTCAAVQAIIGIAQPDKVKVQAVNDYVLSTLSTIDGTYVARGDPGIIAPMSDEGRNNTIKMVILWCGEHPEDTLRQRTAQIYPGMKGGQKTWGSTRRLIDSANDGTPVRGAFVRNWEDPLSPGRRFQCRLLLLARSVKPQGKSTSTSTWCIILTNRTRRRNQDILCRQRDGEALNRSRNTRSSFGSNISVLAAADDTNLVAISRNATCFRVCAHT